MELAQRVRAPNRLSTVFALPACSVRMLVSRPDAATGGMTPWRGAGRIADPVTLPVASPRRDSRTDVG